MKLDHTPSGRFYNFTAKDDNEAISIVGKCSYEGIQPILIEADVFDSTSNKIGTIKYSYKDEKIERNINVSSYHYSLVYSTFATLMTQFAALYTTPDIQFANEPFDTIAVDDTTVGQTKDVNIAVRPIRVSGDVEVAVSGAGLSVARFKYLNNELDAGITIALSFTPAAAGALEGAYLLLFSAQDKWCHKFAITAKGV